MPAQALILSRDEKLIGTFTRAFSSISITAHSDAQVGNSLRLLAKNKYDAVVVDCDHSADAADVLVAIRSGKSNKNAIVFAVLPGEALRKETLSSGANFTLEKPLSTDKVMRNIRAAHGLILAERRRYSRFAVKAPIFVQELSAPRETPGELINISDSGGAVSLRSKDSKKDSGVRVRFVLPGSTAMITGNAQVKWTKENGEIGICFTQLTNASRNELKEWLQHKWQLQEGEESPRGSHKP